MTTASLAPILPVEDLDLAALEQAKSPAVVALAITPVAAKASAKAKKSRKVIRATDVLAYLTRNPQFFTEHADKLGRLSQPKKAGNLLSLHAFQAGRAEKEISRLTTRQQQFFATAHANASIANTMFDLTLKAQQLTSLGQLRTWLQTQLPETLRLNATRFYLAAEATTASTLTPDDILAMCPYMVTLRTLTQVGERDIYGPKGKLITSDALLRLDHPVTGQPLGLLALGSTEAARFHAGQSTELAAFFTRALAIRLHQLLAKA